MELTLAARARSLGAAAHADSSDAISLDSGYAFPGIFPNLVPAAERALTRYRAESLQYGKPFGLPELRTWLAQFLATDGVHVPVDDIIIVNGAKNGLDLLCRLFTEDGDTVVVTAPMYFTAIPIMKSFGLRFVEIAQDDEGMDVPALAAQLEERKRRAEAMPKFIYDVPDFHNPSGITMSRRRREALLELAKRWNVPIVEDTPYRALRYEGTPEPSLKALDRDGIVFALGTFSKLLAPGLRVGWIAGDHAMLERVARLKSDGGTCPLTSRIVLEFCKDGGMEAHLEEARAAYASHRDLMVAALRREIPDAEFTVPHGGYYLWVRLPEGTNTDTLAHRAFDEGVSVIPGALFFAGNAARERLGIEPHRYLRIAYSRATPDEIEAGVQRLAAAYRAMG